MQKYLNKNQLHLVKPKFRKMIKDALENGEKVPYSVVYISDKKISKRELQLINDLNIKYKWEDV
jgi:hypothetical protein